MNREQIVERMAEEFAEFDQCDAPEDSDYARARMALSIALPQVATLAELEVLPEGSLLITPNGEPVRHLYAHARTEVDWLAAYDFLTVVWTPDR